MIELFSVVNVTILPLGVVAFGVNTDLDVEFLQDVEETPNDDSIVSVCELC